MFKRVFINRLRPPHWTGGTDGGRCLSGTSSFRGFSSATQGKDKWKPSPKGKTKFAVIQFTVLAGVITRIGEQRLGNTAWERGTRVYQEHEDDGSDEHRGQPQLRLERKLPIKQLRAQHSPPAPLHHHDLHHLNIRPQFSLKLWWPDARGKD